MRNGSKVHPQNRGILHRWSLCVSTAHVGKVLGKNLKGRPTAKRFRLLMRPEALPKAQANVIEAETSEIPPPKNSNPTLP